MIDEIIEEIGDSKKKPTQEEFLAKLNSFLKGKKLDKIINDFFNYRNKTKGEIIENYPSLIKELAFFFLFLEDINNFINISFEENNRTDKIKYRINVCSKLYNKSLQTFIDIFGLLENGSVSNVYLLWRSIYENYVITKYLIDGPEEESKLFNEHKIIQEKRLLNKGFTDEEVERFTKLFGKDFKNDFSWAKRIKGIKTINKIIKYINENTHYQFYILSTLIGHSSSFSVNRGIISQDEIPNTAMIGYFPDNVTHQVNLLLTTLTDYAKVLLEHFVNKDYRLLIERLLDYYGVEIDKKYKSNFYVA
jgi:hypothetical protein